MDVKFATPGPQPGSVPTTPVARPSPAPHATKMCPLKPDRIDASLLIGAIGVAGLFVPVAGEAEMGAALGALGEAALARGLAAAPALMGVAKFIGDGLSRNPNGPLDTAQWLQSTLNRHRKAQNESTQ